jgi:hypothetical protein
LTPLPEKGILPPGLGSNVRGQSGLFTLPVYSLSWKDNAMAIPSFRGRSSAGQLASQSRMLTAWAILMLACEADLTGRPAVADEAKKSATHAQERLIKVVNGNSREKLTTFAVDRQGRVIAGVSGDKALLRIFDSEGKQVAEWPLPVPPEAVNVGPKGDVYVGGNGKLLLLDSDGAVTKVCEAPNLAGAKDAAVAIQKKIQERAQLDVAARQREQIRTSTKRLADLAKKIAIIDRELKAIADEADTGPDFDAKEEEQREQERKGLLKKRAALVRLGKNLKTTIAAPTGNRGNASGQGPAAEPQPPSIDQLVAAQARIASISASTTDVFFACSSSTGNGFDVWRTDLDFEQGRKISESLRGCCGQMDVQANDNGVYVAENTKHRVSCYTREGESVLDFGSRERGSDASFEGCCNPMNVAFGPGRSVYTAEAGSGRVKRFSADGTFMELVGSVELVPGCKKVSIAVSPKGDRVYMLDITRGHIVVMASSETPPNAAASSPQTDSLTSLDAGR